MHQSEYVQRVRETAANAKPGEPTVVADFDDPDGFTYVHQSSFADALQVRRRRLVCQQPLAGQQLISICMHQRLSGDTQGRHDRKGVSGLTGCSAGTDLHGPCACSSHSVVPLEWAVSKCISASVDSLAKLLQNALLRSMLYSCILK